MTGNSSEKIRIDKWLWAARFFKTRAQATQAVAGGLVHAREDRIKPSRIVQIGDILHIRRGLLQYEVKVIALSEKRGPAPIARTLYEETEKSLQDRERVKEQSRLLRAAEIISGPVKRPGKRDRRKIRAFIRKD